MHQNSGQCRCGTVQFKVSVPPLITMACHCTGCQRMTASAFSLSALYPLNEFEVTAGTPVIGGLHGATRHYFCGHCMSWLYTRPEGENDFVNVRATMMKNAHSFRPFAETYTDEMLPWATTGAELSFEKFPSETEFPTLIDAFVRR